MALLLIYHCVCVSEILHPQLFPRYGKMARWGGSNRGGINEGKDPTSAFKGLTLKTWVEAEFSQDIEQN